MLENVSSRKYYTISISQYFEYPPRIPFYWHNAYDTVVLFSYFKKIFEEIVYLNQ